MWGIVFAGGRKESDQARSVRVRSGQTAYSSAATLGLTRGQAGVAAREAARKVCARRKSEEVSNGQAQVPCRRCRGVGIRAEHILLTHLVYTAVSDRIRYCVTRLL